MPSPSAFANAILPLLSLSSRQAASWPNPEPCSGNCTFVHDPSVVRRGDGTWFRFSTLGDIAIATAPALAGPWTYKGAMLPGGTSKIHVVDGQELWAPDVSIISNTFYSYYSVSKSGRQDSDIGVATSTTGDVGSWTDHGSVGVPKSSDYNLIDPNFFRECPTCKPYWNFGSAWKGVYQTSLKTDFLTWSGEAPANEAFNSSHPAHPHDYPSITEGAFLFWWPVNNQKFYYLFFSSGACCNAANDLEAPGDEYKIMVCRATSPTGPFVDQSGKNCLTQNGGTLVLGSHGDVYAPGGQGVIVDSDSGTDRIALYYHYANPKIGYAYNQFLFGYNYLDFSSGWPVVTAV